MLDHIILTVSDIKRSLAFYEAALKPLNIKFFMPYKSKDGHPDLWGFGDGKKAFFWIKQGKTDPTAIQWGFAAENRNKVVCRFLNHSSFHCSPENTSTQNELQPGLTTYFNVRCRR